MSQVIGIPLLKGNSNVLVAAALGGTFGIANWFTGQAVGISGLFGGVQPVVVALDDPDSVGFYGFICEINRDSGRATIVRAAESVALPSDGTISDTGQVLVDPATGLISDTGTIEVAGTIIDDGSGSLTAKDGKTGNLVADPVLINLSVSPIFVAAPLTAAKSKLTSDKG